MILDRALREAVSPFYSLPNPNDHIQILNERGQSDLLRVDYVQHTPASRVSDPMVRLARTEAVARAAQLGLVML